jgi:protein-S-isoprenylcysteine O-methyltransferase Ste14
MSPAETRPRRRATAVVGSALFLIAAPGVAAGLVPWLLTGWEVEEPLAFWAPLRVVGVIMILAGAAVLIHAFARFALEGIGTPAPVAPTEHLVVGGLYRHVRNPMYLAVLSLIVGQALALGQLVLVPYAAILGAVFAAFVSWYEEPTLARQFGAEYEAYRRAVPGWWPRLRPWRPGGG